MVTGQQVETGETCVTERDYTMIPHPPLTLEDYSEEELDRWLTCNSLTEHQRLILTSAGKLGGPTGGMTSGATEDLTDVSDQNVHDQGGCHQAQPRMSFILLLLGLAALLKRRRFELN